MARPLRLEFPGAVYHVTSRGDRREAIYEDDTDRRRFLDLLGQVIEAFNWVCTAYCLMTNHYHLVIQTPDGNLSKGMRHLNGVYTQFGNRRHGRSGHLLQGRYKAILVDADRHLLELTRYVVLNPVRAGMAVEPGTWPWSSYRATAGAVPEPAWLATNEVRAQFGKRRENAIRRYVQFVADGIGGEPIWQRLNRQVFLGDDAFVARMHQTHNTGQDDINIPSAQRRPPPASLSAIAAAHPIRDAAMAAAHATGQYSYQQIAEFFGVHFTTVGRAVRVARGRGYGML
ncbi:MAG: transposase [Immundisolibacter sp.]|uniref:transposase n=1 Tax=Immundisolibacter sp. TaxID=1934948 RepID=UPI003EDF98E5